VEHADIIGPRDLSDLPTIDNYLGCLLLRSYSAMKWCHTIQFLCDQRFENRILEPRNLLLVHGQILAVLLIGSGSPNSFEVQSWMELNCESSFS
jgi:hypothetical protein